LRPRTVKTADAKIIKGGGSGGVVGVIANLGLYFVLHTLFLPDRVRSGQS
jgi:hypothetical protein